MKTSLMKCWRSRYYAPRKKIKCNYNLYVLCSLQVSNKIYFFFSIGRLAIRGREHCAFLHRKRLKSPPRRLVSATVLTQRDMLQGTSTTFQTFLSAYAFNYHVSHHFCANSLLLNCCETWRSEGSENVLLLSNGCQYSCEQAHL